MHNPPESQFQHKKKRQNNQHHQQYQPQTQAPWTPPNQPLQPPSPWMVPPTTWPPQMPPAASSDDSHAPTTPTIPQHQQYGNQKPRKTCNGWVSLVFPVLLAQLIMFSVLIAVHGVILRQFVEQTHAHHLHNKIQITINNQIKQINFFLLGTRAYPSEG